MLPVRDVWRPLRGAPQFFLGQPDQLGHDAAYAVALGPPVALGLFFFRRQALLLFSLCFLAGIVCVLSLQFARLTIGLPAWVGHKANHPLISSLLVASFLSPQTQAWIGVTLVVLLVVLDALVWPQLLRVMVHPALVVFAVLALIERQFPVGFVNPFDLRPLDDPLTLWYRLHVLVDPVKLYVGNVPGPLAATSAGALGLGLAYLWYTNKIAVGVLFGFLGGVAVTAVAFGYDLAFQLSSGPTLFVVGYLAADRRRVLIPERLAVALAASAGGLTVVLRGLYGQGLNATWQSVLVLGLLSSAVLQIMSGGVPLLGRRVRRPATPVVWRRLQSGAPRAAAAAQVPVSARAPHSAMVGRPSLAASRYPAPGARSLIGYEAGPNPDELVRRMRLEAARSPLGRGKWVMLRTLALVLINPLGLWLTWHGQSSRRTKWLLTAASTLWYPLVALVGLVLVGPPAGLSHLLR